LLSNNQRKHKLDLCEKHNDDYDDDDDDDDDGDKNG